MRNRAGLSGAEDCNAFVRQAMDYWLNLGAASETVENSGLGADGQTARALVAAHNTWVDVDSRNAFALCQRRRAKAAFELLILPSDAGLFRITFKYPGQPGESAREIFGNRVGQRWRPN